MAAESRIDSVIGKDTVIEGDIKVDGSTKIDGSINGNIMVKDALILGKTCNIKGNIACKSAIIGGIIEGNVNVQELLEFQSGAHILGDITCKALIVQQGVIFDGNCRMSAKTKESSK